MTSSTNESSRTEAEFGSRLGVLKATPRKRFLRDSAMKLSIPDAVGEVVDNFIDNFARQRQLGYDADDLVIDIQLNPDEIVIRENSGGITPEDLTSFVQIGSSGREVEGAPRIGVWGSGQKLALARLGYNVTISSRHWQSDAAYQVPTPRGEVETGQVILHMNDEWWSNDDSWDVPVFAASTDLPRGETCYVVRSVNSFTPDAVDAVKKQLLVVYGDWLAETRDTQISVNGVSLRELLEHSDFEDERVRLEIPAIPRLTDAAISSTFAFPPGMQPSRHLFELTAPPMVEGASPRRLKMEIIVGLTPRQEKKRAGVYMFGVPATAKGAKLGARLFTLQPLQDESVGYSEGPGPLRKGDPTLGRLRMYVIFYGASVDIPWGEPGSPVKRGYNSVNDYAAQIRARIVEVARPYARITARAREIDLVPFSDHWDQASNETRMEIIRRGVGLKEMNDLDVADPELLRKLQSLATRTRHAVDLLEWDHVNDDEPPMDAPVLNESKSKSFVKKISERDKNLKQHKDEPDVAVGVFVDSIEELYEELPELNWTEAEEPQPREITVSYTVRLPSGVMRQVRQRSGLKRNEEALKAAVMAYVQEGAEQLAS